jgi:DNA-binding GntR family transcriptional regulator
MATLLDKRSDLRVKRESLAKQVADGVREAILMGDFKPGQKLTEAELADRFGVSHIVIREAFHMLQGEGIVLKDTFRTRSVFNLDESKATDLLVLRTSLESLAAYWAAERLTPVWKERIIEVADRIKRVRATTYGDWVELELSFHRTVWGAAQNEWLSKQLSQLAVQIFSFHTMHLFKPSMDFQTILREAAAWEGSNHPQGHQQISISILKGDSEKARESMIVHIMGAPCSAELRKKIFYL